MFLFGVAMRQPPKADDRPNQQQINDTINTWVQTNSDKGIPRPILQSIVEQKVRLGYWAVVKKDNTWELRAGPNNPEGASTPQNAFENTKAPSGYDISRIRYDFVYGVGETNIERIKQRATKEYSSKRTDQNYERLLIYLVPYYTSTNFRPTAPKINELRAKKGEVDAILDNNITLTEKVAKIIDLFNTVLTTTSTPTLQEITLTATPKETKAPTTIELKITQGTVADGTLVNVYGPDGKLIQMQPPLAINSSTASYSAQLPGKYKFEVVGFRNNTVEITLQAQQPAATQAVQQRPLTLEVLGLNIPPGKTDDAQQAILNKLRDRGVTAVQIEGTNVTLTYSATAPYNEQQQTEIKPIIQRTITDRYPAAPVAAQAVVSVSTNAGITSIILPTANNEDKIKGTLDQLGITNYELKVNLVTITSSLPTGITNEQLKEILTIVLTPFNTNTNTARIRISPPIPQNASLEDIRIAIVMALSQNPAISQYNIQGIKLENGAVTLMLGNRLDTNSYSVINSLIQSTISAKLSSQQPPQVQSQTLSLKYDITDNNQEQIQQILMARYNLSRDQVKVDIATNTITLTYPKTQSIQETDVKQVLQSRLSTSVEPQGFNLETEYSSVNDRMNQDTQGYLKISYARLDISKIDLIKARLERAGYLVAREGPDLIIIQADKYADYCIVTSKDMLEKGESVGLGFPTRAIAEQVAKSIKARYSDTYTIKVLMRNGKPHISITKQKLWASLRVTQDLFANPDVQPLQLALNDENFRKGVRQLQYEMSRGQGFITVTPINGQEIRVPITIRDSSGILKYINEANWSTAIKEKLQSQAQEVMRASDKFIIVSFSGGNATTSEVKIKPTPIPQATQRANELLESLNSSPLGFITYTSGTATSQELINIQTQLLSRIDRLTDKENYFVIRDDKTVSVLYIPHVTSAVIANLTILNQINPIIAKDKTTGKAFAEKLVQSINTNDEYSSKYHATFDGSKIVVIQKTNAIPNLSQGAQAVLVELRKLDQSNPIVQKLTEYITQNDLKGDKSTLKLADRDYEINEQYQSAYVRISDQLAAAFKAGGYSLVLETTRGRRTSPPSPNLRELKITITKTIQPTTTQAPFTITEGSITAQNRTEVIEALNQLMGTTGTATGGSQGNQVVITPTSANINQDTVKYYLTTVLGLINSTAGVNNVTCPDANTAKTIQSLSSLNHYVAEIQPDGITVKVTYVPTTGNAIIKTLSSQLSISYSPPLPGFNDTNSKEFASKLCDYLNTKKKADSNIKANFSIDDNPRQVKIQRLDISPVDAQPRSTVSIPAGRIVTQELSDLVNNPVVNAVLRQVSNVSTFAQGQQIGLPLEIIGPGAQLYLQVASRLEKAFAKAGYSLSYNSAPGGVILKINRL